MRKKMKTRTSGGAARARVVEGWTRGPGGDQARSGPEAHPRGGADDLGGPARRPQGLRHARERLYHQAGEPGPVHEDRGGSREFLALGREAAAEIARAARHPARVELRAAA